MRRVSLRGVLATIAVVIVAGVCIRLGFWQLNRLEERRSFNAAVSAAMALPPLELTADALAALDREPHAHLYRRGIAVGTYEPGDEVLLRGRAHAGRPGVHLVAPLHISATDALILVNRGWIPAPDAATADPRPLRSSGAQRVEGIFQWVPDAGAEASPLLLDLGDTTVSTLRRLDHMVLSATLGTPLPRLYLQELPGARMAGDLPIPISPPELDEGPHLGYAIQWFSFALIAVGGFLLVAYRATR